MVGIIPRCISVCNLLYVATLQTENFGTAAKRVVCGKWAPSTVRLKYCSEKSGSGNYLEIIWNN